MARTKDDISASFTRFRGNWLQDFGTVTAGLYADKASRDKLADSYRRMVSIHSWRVTVLAERCPGDVGGFFKEAQNDFLMSHVFASAGAVRPALQTLRSGLEDIATGLYYAEHPVEFERWNRGKHRLTVSELFSYFRTHPRLEDRPASVCPLGNLESEYSSLSRAVHGSAVNFRMTGDSDGNIVWKGDKVALSKWNTRHTQVLRGCNLLLLNLFSEELEGTKRRDLRRLIGQCLTATQANAVRQTLSINLALS